MLPTPKAKVNKPDRSDRNGGKTQLLIHKVPVQTFQKFKAACARRGAAMREVVIEFMKRYPNE